MNKIAGQPDLPASADMADPEPPNPQSDVLAHRESIRGALAEHEGALVRYADSIVHDLDRARDVVQDTFLKLCRQKQLPDNGGRMAAWLFRVCRNRAIDVCRKECRMKTTAESTLERENDSGALPDEIALKKESAIEVARQVAELPERQQEILRLKFEGGLSYAEIAEVMDLTKTNVGFILHTAIAKLRSMSES